MEVSDGPILPSPSSLAATTPDPLNMNTPDFTLTPSSTTLNLPQSSAAKPGKKRKSWGQALPEPKTNLPPRKRAKTADEKEQRRIERIKRNRAAAHNSRERKRQEAERLEVENHQLVQRIQALQHQLAHKDATLAKCKELLPGGLPELTSDDLASMSFPEESIISTPSSLDTIDPRASLAPTTPGDLTTACVKIEPLSPSVHMMPPPSSVSAKKGQHSLDQTQHSAAMLCDLQCRSNESSPSRWSLIILWLMHVKLMECYKSIMIASWTLWPTRMAQMVDTLTSTASSASTNTTTTTTRPTTSPRRRILRRRLQATATATTTTTATSTATSPLTLISTTLSSLMVSLSQATLAQSILATGPRHQVTSARQSALPSGESQMYELSRKCQRIMVEQQEAIKTASEEVESGHIGRSGRSSLGGLSEERKDHGGVG